MKSILIAGAGTMGRGIAELMALSNFEVQLWDHRPGTLGRASATIEKSLRSQYRIGRISELQLDQALERVRLISDLRVVHPRTELAIEAVVEDVEIKREVIRKLEEVLPEAWYATHTASLKINDLCAALKRPGRLVGMHFFNPAPVMPLVEISYCVKTEEVWVRRAVELAEHQLGKRTIVVKDSPGFVSTRLNLPMALEAMRMVEQNVASVEDIDKAMEYGFRYPMGPLRESDWVGLDVRLHIAQALYRELKQDCFRPPKILERMVAEGKLGRKSGEGFYKWPSNT